MYIEELKYSELLKTNPKDVFEYSKRIMREYSFMLDGVRFFVNSDNLREIIIDIPEQETLLENKINTFIGDIEITNILDTYNFYNSRLNVELSLFGVTYFLLTGNVTKLVYDYDDDFDE